MITIPVKVLWVNSLLPTEVYNLRGDSPKATKILRWTPKTKFKELVKIIVGVDLKRLAG